MNYSPRHAKPVEGLGSVGFVEPTNPVIPKPDGSAGVTVTTQIAWTPTYRGLRSECDRRA